jgi:serine phosphatase RsbU (regulator of sigma subunit)
MYKFLRFKFNSIYSIVSILLFMGVIFATLGIAMFYQFQSVRLQESALQIQKDKARQIAYGIEDYLRITIQLSRSLTSLAAPLRQHKNEVETLLYRMLQSAPEEIIYGMGVWFEPYLFDKEIELFGPYVHRSQTTEISTILTYEWSQQDYYYPKQFWYLEGRKKEGKTFFTAPYFDTNLVYMSAIQAFYDQQGRFAGVTSVDMILPLLQKFVAKFNISKEEVIYVVTQEGKLFVHPNENELMAYAKKLGLSINSILDLNKSHLEAFMQSQGEKQRVMISSEVADVHWQVHVLADEANVFYQVIVLRNNLLWATGLLWLLFIFLFVLLLQAHKARVKHNKLKEKLKEQNRKQKLLQDINDALEDKVKARTLELETAHEKICHLNEQLKAENLRMGSELEISRRLQQMVLPRAEELTQIPDLDIAGFMQPASEVGGDYYDILRDTHGVKITIGDVTGHGLESGVIMLMVQTAIRTLLASHSAQDSSHFLAVINRAIYENVQRMRSDKNLTLAILDYAQGQVTISGQHEEVLIVRAHGEIEQIDTLELGFMVGMIPDIYHLLGKKQIELATGDGVVLYTDGITEARNHTGKLYGLPRLLTSIQRHWPGHKAQFIQQAIIADLMNYLENHPIDDDITLVVLKRV